MVGLMSSGTNKVKSMTNFARDWFAQAEFDIKLAKMAQDTGSHGWACFAAQQSAEKAVTSLHLFLGRKAWGRIAAQLMLELPTTPPEDLVTRAMALDNLHSSTRFSNIQQDEALNDHLGPSHSMEALNHAREILAFVHAEMTGRDKLAE